MSKWMAIVAAMMIISGCATGRTDFRVIQEIPASPPEVASEVEATTVLQPEVDAPSDQAAPTALPERESTQADQVTIQVQPGDTLSELCQRILRDPWVYPQIAAHNNISNPDLIFPEQVIVFPKTTEAARHEPASQPEQPAQIKSGQPKPDPAGIDFPEVANQAFAPGEQLTFSVEYFGISAGYATLSVHEGRLFHGRPTYHLVAQARTHPAFEWFFKVRDRIESYMDKQGLFSWRYEKHLREGSYKNHSVIAYLQLEQKVSKDNGKQVVDAPPWTQDVLSEFYYFRVLPLNIGETITIPVVADNAKVYELIVKVIKKERITVPAGTFDCIKVEPFLKFEGLFQHKGKMHIWVTDDNRRVPVLIKSQIVIGTIDIVLRDAIVVDIK